MENKLGVENVGGFAVGLCQIANTGIKAGADGKIDAWDVPAAFAGLSQAAITFASVKYGQLFPEIKDLVPEEYDQLVDKIADSLEVSGESVKAELEGILQDSKVCYEAFFRVQARIAKWKEGVVG